MRYIEITEHTLEDARPGLILVEQLMRDEEFTPYIYGMTTKEVVLMVAAEAIADNEGPDDDGNLNTPTLTEIAVAIPLDSDALYYLQGSGLLLQFEDFSYKLPGSGEGTRTDTLSVTGTRPRVHLNDFTALAIAQDSLFLDNFYDQYAAKELEGHAEVKREEPAIEAPAPEPVAEPAPVEPAPEAAPEEKAPKAASKAASGQSLNPIDSFLAG